MILYCADRLVARPCSRAPTLSAGYKCPLWLKSAGNGSLVHSFIETGLFLVSWVGPICEGRCRWQPESTHLSAKPNWPIRRTEIWNLKHWKYGICRRKICKCDRRRLKLCLLACHLLNWTRSRQTMLDWPKLEKLKKVTELTLSSSRQNFIWTIGIVNGKRNGRRWLKLNEEQRSGEW